MLIGKAPLSFAYAAFPGSASLPATPPAGLVLLRNDVVIQAVCDARARALMQATVRASGETMTIAGTAPAVHVPVSMTLLQAPPRDAGT